MKSESETKSPRFLQISVWLLQAHRMRRTWWLLVHSKVTLIRRFWLDEILRIFWSNTISNEELYKWTNTTPLSQEIKRRRWTCIGHVCRMHPTSIPRVALRWTPTGKRKRGRPKETWRRFVEKEMKEKDWSWGQVQHWSQNRQAWKSLVMALCALPHEED